jgi:hypothetical protein
VQDGADLMKKWWYCFVNGHDRYMLPLILMGTCKNCGHTA